MNEPSPGSEQEWLALDISATVKKPSTGGIPIEFELRFINSSSAVQEFPKNMRHWKNSHPLHLTFFDPSRHRIDSLTWGSESVLQTNRELTTLQPNQFVSVSFSGLLTPERSLEFSIFCYDFSEFDFVFYRYKYRRILTETKTLTLPSAEHDVGLKGLQP